MNDRLDRRTQRSSGKERYGTWDLASDREAMEPPVDEPLEPREAPEWDEATDQRVRVLVARQRRLSLAATAILLGLVLLVVVVSHLYPETMARPIWRGFSPAFLAMGVLIYPLTWVVSALFVVLSNRLDGLP